MDSYKTKFKRDIVTALCKLVESIIIDAPEGAVDKMHIAILCEIKERLEGKLLKVKKEYSVTLTPAQAIALHIMSVQYLPISSHLGNRMFIASNEIIKQYKLS